MQLPKELVTVTPLSKALALFLFATLPIVGFFLGMNYQRQLMIPYNNLPVIPSSSPKPTTVAYTTITPAIAEQPQPTCVQGKPERVSITTDHKLKDTIHNYSLDLSQIPEATMTDTLSCSNVAYEIDMYPLSKEYGGSVARFSVQAPYDNKIHLSLTEYAKTKLRYVEGRHSDGIDNYGQPFTSTILTEKSLPNGTKLLEWTNIYTEQDTHQEGTTATKYYLLETDNKIVMMYVMAWDMPTLHKATADFDTVVTSFKIVNEKPL